MCVEHGYLRFWSPLSRWLLGGAVFFLCALGSPMAQANSFDFGAGVVTVELTGGDDIAFKIDKVAEDAWGADNPSEDSDALWYKINDGAWTDGLEALIADVESIIVNGDDAAAGNVIDGSLLTGDEAPPMQVNAGGGDDVVFGGADADQIDGGAGDDILDGGAGADEISGGIGNDLIRGGQDGDTRLGGGGGWDVLDYSTDAGGAGVVVNLQENTATDGWGDEDTIVADSFSAVRGKEANDSLTGYTGRVNTILGGGGDDTIIGGAMADILFGDDGDDVIDGSDGADYIFGGLGDDTINGGDGESSGNDIICGDGDASPYWPPYVDPDTGLSDAVQLVNVGARIPPQIIIDFGGSDDINGGWGNDWIYGGGGSDRINGGPDEAPIYGDNDVIYGDLDYDLDGDGVNEEDVTQGGVDYIRGGYGMDNIFPGAGIDYASGGAGEDRIYGSAGVDYIFGGDVLRDPDGFGTDTPEIDNSPADWVDYSYSPNFVTVVLSAGVIAPGYAFDGEALQSSDIIYGIENINGSPNDDILTGTDIIGNDLSRYLNGGYDNRIYGNDGNDTIYGGLGDDLLRGYSGNDTLWGDGGNQFEGGDDRLDGGDGDDTLHGEGGDDFLRGASGNDIISGGVGEDTLDYSLVGAGIVLDLSGGGDGTATNDGNGSTDTLDNCDSTAGFVVDCSAGSGNEFYSRVEIVLGSRNADTITGYTDWPTEIWGGSGNDTLTGGEDDDVIWGETGNDTIEGGLGDDTLMGGEDAGNLDTDTVTYANAPGAVTVNLGMTGPQNTSAAGFDTINEFENLTGSANDDLLIGSEEANVITGGAGNDILTGRGDQDVVINGIGFVRWDKLYGGGGTNYADYRFSPTQPVVDLDTGVLVDGVMSDGHTSDDGEGGSDQLFDIDSALLPNEALYVTAGPSWTISLGGSVQLQGNATGGSNNAAHYRYVWDTVPPTEPEPGQEVGDVEIPGLDNRCKAMPLASPEETTIYRLTVTDCLEPREADSCDPCESDPGGLVTVTSNFVKITVADDLLVDAGPDELTITSGQSIQLSGSASGGVTPYTVAWSPDTGLSKTDILLPTASPETTTTYTLTVTDQTSQEVSDSITINVTNPFTVNAGADVSIAAGQSTQLNAVVQGGTSPYTYLWTPALGLSSATIANPTASPTAAMTAYTVKVTDSTSRIATDTVIVSITSSGGQQQGSGGDTDGGDTGPTVQPQSSPVDQTDGGTGGTTTIWTLPTCGAGVSQALVLTNLLLLLGVYRRRR